MTLVQRFALLTAPERIGCDAAGGFVDGCEQAGWIAAYIVRVRDIRNRTRFRKMPKRAGNPPPHS
jgi:hypothetical protein